MANVLVTGSDGFVGKNLCVWLKEHHHKVCLFQRETDLSELNLVLPKVDFICHLAGVNRAPEDKDFISSNQNLTELLCQKIKELNVRVPVIFTSSKMVSNDSNIYSQTKRSAEQCLIKLAKKMDFPLLIFRLPNLFGKWSKPNYNSVVATFCHNISRGLPIVIHDRRQSIELLYIDDLMELFLDAIQKKFVGQRVIKRFATEKTTVGFLADTFENFQQQRKSFSVDNVGSGLLRKLYATYLSFLPEESFCQSLTLHSDSRGSFIEFVKTKESGQFSIFTAKPGQTRGGHYHHTKNEKFMVLNGTAKFCFRNILNGDCFTLKIEGLSPNVVESVPGYWHSITNIGDCHLLVALWTNEVFEPGRPDTFSE